MKYDPVPLVTEQRQNKKSNSKMDRPVKMNFFKKWLICSRPFSFPASTMPVVFGSVGAAAYGGYAFKPGLFILSLLGMVVLHSAANILSDINDYKKGLDRVPIPVSGGVVRGMITLKEALVASAILFLAGALIGFYLAWKSGPLLLAIGGLGLLVGIFYTRGGKISLKYHALGDLAVFLNFGILGSLGSWYVQSGSFSWIPVVWAVPMAMHVIAILHANNWRDIVSDKKGDITTIASLLGDNGSLRYYAFMIFGPFAIVLGLIFAPRILPGDIPAMPLPFLLTLMALPLALKLWHKAIRRKEPIDPLDFIALDGATAKLNLLFGTLCTVALLLNVVILNLK